MRGFIDEGKFQRAVDRASRFIKSNNNNIRNGASMTPATREANNILCVASTSIGQIEDAMVACDKSIKQAPKSWESLKSYRVNFLYCIFVGRSAASPSLLRRSAS